MKNNEKKNWKCPTNEIPHSMAPLGLLCQTGQLNKGEDFSFSDKMSFIWRGSWLTWVFPSGEATAASKTSREMINLSFMEMRQNICFIFKWDKIFVSSLNETKYFFSSLKKSQNNFVLFSMHVSLFAKSFLCNNGKICIYLY